MSTNHAIHQIVVFGLSDRGLQRDNNEDHFMVADLTRKAIGVHDNQLRPELFHHDIGTCGTILIVADGLGGHEGGEVASQLAVDIVAQALVNTAEQALPISAQIMCAVDMAHEAICKHHGASGRTRHMASTLTVVHVGHGVMTIAQVGDSRAYRFRGGKLTLLTEDQTVVHMMQKKGMLTPEEAQHHPHRNIILQALGQDKSVLPELQTLPFSHNDSLLLCSDGLSSYVAHERIEEILSSGEDEHVRCRRLVEAANAMGGADNVTVLLARLIIKENVRPEAPNKAPVYSTPHGVEHASTSIRAAEASGPQPAQAASDPLSPAAANTTLAAPASEPAKLSIWKWEIRWPWGHKTASPTALPTPKPGPAEALSLAQNADQEEHAPGNPGNATSTASWDPRVLKAVEDSLAEYIVPVAKILVGRAAHHTKDLHKLCQALAAQLSTEQERKSFLHNALHQKQTHSRRP
jgi:serine/threonine protein phosphatase PrpC